MTASLRTERLSRSFGALAVAKDIDFALPAGARHALIGPNGAGKTTFVNLLTGAVAPSGGRVWLGDADITALPTHRRVKLGLVRTFQINSLFPGFTPLEAVTMAVCERERVSDQLFRGFRWHGALVEEAYDLLARLGLGEVASQRTHELAYGRQRLLEIGLALALRPKVLLLDEPAAGVPERESGELFEAIAALPPDIAIMFIEHDMELVFRFARRITVMVAGEILTEGTPEEIAADERVRRVYLGSAHGG